MRRALSTRAAANPQRTVLPEGEEVRILRAARILVEEAIAHPILLGECQTIRALAAEEQIDLDGIKLIDPTQSPWVEDYARAYWERRNR